MEIFGPDNLRNAACFFATALGIEDYDFTLDIERVSLDGVQGFCVYAPEERVFFIELEESHHKLLGKSVYEILAHEMVHVRQYITGQLVDLKPGVLWEGKYYPQDFPYEESPWEIEAKELQASLERKRKS